MMAYHRVNNLYVTVLYEIFGRRVSDKVIWRMWNSNS